MSETTGRPVWPLPAPSGPCPDGARGHPRPASSLDHLADDLARRPRLDERLWLRVYGRLDRPGLLRWELGDTTLLGWVAPASCAAVGVLAPGWATTGDGMPVRVQAMVVLDRRGTSVSRVYAGDVELLRDPPQSGRLLEVLRRCFGLPTPPPPAGSAQLIVRLWLDRLAADERTPLTWTDVCRHHPVMTVLEAAGAGLDASFVRSATLLGQRAWSWEELHRQARAGGWLADALPAGTAPWMDTGMFARWLLDSWPDTADLLDLVEPRLVPEARRALRACLADLGVVTA